MTTTEVRRRRGRTGLLVLLIVLAVGLAVVDQVTKYVAEANLTPGVVIPLLGDVLGLQLIYNPGAAFSLATGMTWIFTVVAVVVVVVVLRAARKLGSLGWAIALGMLLGGCLGNLYDRLLRDPGFARGHVVDFINYNGWFVGNVADIAIVAAAVLIAILAIRGIEIDGSRAGDEPVVAAAPAEEPADDDTAADADVDVAAWVTGRPARGDAPVADGPGADGPAVPGDAAPERGDAAVAGGSTAGGSTAADADATPLAAPEGANGTARSRRDV
ncbi:signal peptidase II [Georgenia wangjunii]|uniref:signal peptidase II n=1 Tax=Georgenia wangjunii TaxID=3117730 RepID=UPI002F26C017